MTRGDYTVRKILGDKKHQTGFGFISKFDLKSRRIIKKNQPFHFRIL